MSRRYVVRQKNASTFCVWDSKLEREVPPGPGVNPRNRGIAAARADRLETAR